jgi:hypothetical protein
MGGDGKIELLEIANFQFPSAPELQTITCLSTGQAISKQGKRKFPISKLVKRKF